VHREVGGMIHASARAPANDCRKEESTMAKQKKLPPGLYRRRRREGTAGEIIWCQ
jgi:hypothetical protein